MPAKQLAPLILSGCLGSVLVCAVGCSSGGTSPGPTPLTGAASTSLNADWDDTEAAVAAALGKSELVKVSLDRSNPGRLVYTLRTSRDEPAVLTIDRLTGPAAAGSVQLKVTCSIGRFGDADREHEFIALVTERLEQLRGVEVAPIRD